MPTKNDAGKAEWTDPDDAPELTEEMIARMDIYEGEKLIKRGRGRPPVADRKEQVSLRLDPDVLEKLRADGPGWQTRVNDILRGSLGL